MQFPKKLRFHYASCAAAFILSCWFASAAESGSKPVLLYSRHYNAEGEQRYLPDGTYKDVLHRLEGEFNVRVNSDPLTDQSLKDVKLVLIANPSDKAVGNHPAPHHFLANDISVLRRFISAGGGLIVMGNQENHNLEIEDTNKLLANFGIQFTNLYTDAKKLVLPKETPIVGGLRWAYYTGNLLTVVPKHSAKPRGLIVNDLDQKPPKGTRDQAGILLAIAEPGKGRVAVVTDSGWITDSVFAEKGIGDVAIKGQDNWEIFRRLARWNSGFPVE